MSLWPPTVLTIEAIFYFPLLLADSSVHADFFACLAPFHGKLGATRENAVSGQLAMRRPVIEA